MREHAGQNYILVINEGEIVGVFTEDNMEDAQDLAYSINDSNTLDAIEESGRDADDLTVEEYGEFAIMGGYEGGYAYVESVTFPNPDDFCPDDVELSEDDYCNYKYGDMAFKEYVDSDYITHEDDNLAWLDILDAVTDAFTEEECDEDDFD